MKSQKTIITRWKIKDLKEMKIIFPKKRFETYAEWHHRILKELKSLI